MHDHAHAETPEQEIAIAQQAFQSGDLKRALHHVGSALSTNPTNPAWLALQDAILRRADDPLGLTAPQDGSTDFVSAATRAYTFAMRRQWLEALGLVSQVVSVRPDVPYLAWAEQWMRQPGVANATFDELMPALLIPLVKGLPSARGPQDPALANLRHAAAILAFVRAAHPNRGFVWYVSSVVARRMGAPAEAQQAEKRSAPIIGSSRRRRATRGRSRRRRTRAFVARRRRPIARRSSRSASASPTRAACSPCARRCRARSSGR